MVRSWRLASSNTHEVVVTDGDKAELAMATALAAVAIINGVQAGDYRWHGGASDYKWKGQRFDAPGLIEHARTRL